MIEEEREIVWKKYNDSWAYSSKKFEFRYKECKDDFKNKLWSYQLWANSDNYKAIGYLKKGCKEWNAYLKYGAVNLTACVHFLKCQLYRRQNLIERLEKEGTSDWFRTTKTWKETLQEGKITSKEILQEADEIFLELELYIQEILDKGIDEDIEKETYKLKDSINYFIQGLIKELNEYVYTELDKDIEIISNNLFHDSDDIGDFLVNNFNWIKKNDWCCTSCDCSPYEYKWVEYDEITNTIIKDAHKDLPRLKLKYFMKHPLIQELLKNR